MLAQIATFLVQTVFGLFVYLVLLRFFMQTFRVPFRNPLGQLVMTLTNWAVLPLRRAIPSARGFDLASILLAWLALIIKTFLLYVLAGNPIAVEVMLVFPLLELARAILHIVLFVVIVQVILSWVSPYNPFTQVFDTLTRPFYNIFRRFVPPIGGIDFSPLFVALVAQVLLIVIDNLPRVLLAAL